MRGISWLAANQLAAQEGLCTMEWVNSQYRLNYLHSNWNDGLTKCRIIFLLNYNSTLVGVSDYFNFSQVCYKVVRLANGAFNVYVSVTQCAVQKLFNGQTAVCIAPPINKEEFQYHYQIYLICTFVDASSKIYLYSPWTNIRNPRLVIRHMWALCLYESFTRKQFGSMRGYGPGRYWPETSKADLQISYGLLFCFCFREKINHFKI